MADETFSQEPDAMEEGTVLAPAHFSWGATFAGAVIGVAVTFTLLVLGSGVGLVLAPQHNSAVHGAGALFTLGAIYFLAAQAFGMAAGGHVAGRLIGPEIETRSEENFRAGAHGLAVWAISILVTLALVAASAPIAERTALRVGSLYGAAGEKAPADARDELAGYFVDILFRPTSTNEGSHASLDGVQYAQADTPATDAAPGPGQAMPGNGASPSQPAGGEEVPGGQSGPSDMQDQPPMGDQSPEPHAERHVPGDLAPSPPPTNTPAPAALIADKDEVRRILEAATEEGGTLAVDDRDRIAQLVAQDTNISYEAATGRANDVQSRLVAARNEIVDRAKKDGGFVALWLALSLIFGAIIAVIAAVSARWEDDMQTMFSLRRTG
jgi:hypothetical protein